MRINYQQILNKIRWRLIVKKVGKCDQLLKIPVILKFAKFLFLQENMLRRRPFTFSSHTVRKYNWWRYVMKFSTNPSISLNVTSHIAHCAQLCNSVFSPTQYSEIRQHLYNSVQSPWSRGNCGHPDTRWQDVCKHSHNIHILKENFKILFLWMTRQHFKMVTGKRLVSTVPMYVRHRSLVGR